MVLRKGRKNDMRQNGTQNMLGFFV